MSNRKTSKMEGNITHVIAPISARGITRGEKYSYNPDMNTPNSGYITDDSGDTIYIRLKGCAHLLGWDWIPVTERREDLTELLETHYIVVEAIEHEISKEGSTKLHQLVEKEGMGAKWELAHEITMAFQREHAGREWDGDWLETLDDFIAEELKNIQV